jgi:2-oxoglutarate ferredoxin oxidoreductase subunit alpha
MVVENNATAQFARLLHRATGVTAQEKILKYDGMPFSVEELAACFKKVPRFSARPKKAAR